MYLKHSLIYFKIDFKIYYKVVLMTERIQDSSYLGQKGYTIPKKGLSLHEINKIKEDLTVKPFTPNTLIKTEAFPIYRESNAKMYVPRFYGENNYGIANTTKLTQYTPINLEFNGDMRDYQIAIVNKYIEHVNKLPSRGGGGLLEIGCGKGKTVMALRIISLLKVKTLVIVHKGFLLNQWVERIQQFLPEAKIGKIQGPYFDIEDKDIVIGMLQSLSMKEYPQDMFKSFGFVCVDECHHISAEVFVRSLFTVVTPYILGLSATMQRKDGLTKVFKQFIGDMIHSEKNDTSAMVEVRGIEYITEDDDFMNVKLDYRGNPLYSSMISKLCSYNRRTEFILKVLGDVLRENPEQQVIMLSHNKNLLAYIHKAIEHKENAFVTENMTVGYYVGGMKEKDLKISETKTVILATYSMAAEALDIKTLTTLFLLTPKTDVQQAVGRILRVKHSKPLVVDFVDMHDIFQSQWRKRKQFYTKQNYKIIYTNSEMYKAGTNGEFIESNWNTLNIPGEKPKRKTKAKKQEESCQVIIEE